MSQKGDRANSTQMLTEMLRLCWCNWIIFAFDENNNNSNKYEKNKKTFVKLQPLNKETKILEAKITTHCHCSNGGNVFIMLILMGRSLYNIKKQYNLINEIVVQ